MINNSNKANKETIVSIAETITTPPPINAARRVGFWVHPSKYGEHKMDDFILYARTRDVEVVLIDLQRSIEEQGPFKVIFGKVSPLLVEESKDQTKAEMVARLEAYEKNHPEIVFIDSVSKQRALLDRSSMASMLFACESELAEDKTVGFKCPRSITIDTKEDDYSETLKKHAMHYPFMVKNIEAAGSVHAHRMGTIYDEKALHSFEPPFLVQEYFNHNSIIFKVFYIGSEFLIVRRGSLANLPLTGDSVIFNSQDPWPKELTVANPPVTDLARVPNPPDEVIRKIIEAVGKRAGVTIAGIDVITRVETGEHAVIDVNYFPGFKGFADFHKKLLDWIIAHL